MFRRTCLLVASLALALGGCEDQRAAGEARPVDVDRSPVVPPPPAPAGDQVGSSADKPLVVKITTTDGGQVVLGTASLHEEPNGVKVVLDFTNAPPGVHAVHVHQKGDCGNKGENAGPHFAPEGHKHGLPNAPEHHMGDMGNLDITAKGTGRMEFLIQGANLRAGDAHSLLDRAIILHDKEDKGTQPAGDAGGRIGCGRIAR